MADEGGSDSLETPEDVPEDASELESISSQTAYESFLTAVSTVEPALLEECCADIPLAYANVTRGVESVVGSGAVVIGKLPKVDIVELSMLPRLVQGLAFAALQVQREMRSVPFGLLYDRAQVVRRKLRKAAEALAEAHLLAEADIDEVRMYGPQSVLEDCLELAAVLRRNEGRIAGRSPVLPSDLQEAEQLAEKLRTMLGQQQEAADGGVPSLLKVIEVRDRFWTLLSQRHDVLWRCGVWLYGRSVDERVPPLPVRQSVIRKPPRETARPVVEHRRSLSPPSLLPVRVTPPSSVTPRDTTRHLKDVQRELERKTRFFIKMGIIPPQR
jgi:hypothetical protein